MLNNLLHFPTVKHPSAQYGSAIHAALQRAHSHYASSGKKKPIEDVLQDFEQIIASYRMPHDELVLYTQRGTASLSAFLEQNYDTFSPSQRVEIGFGGQQSRVGQAVLTGSLDLMDIDEETRTIVVTDYKTGGASASWQGKSDAEKLKLHRYKQQLMFYKLLVEHARDYTRYDVAKGVLQFVEPTLAGEVVSLDLSFNNADLQNFSNLVEKVYECITALRLPDTSLYASSYAGVLSFEEDLRNGMC